jgi:hypothetical protein
MPLKGEKKGTVYMPTVTSRNLETYTVAIGGLEENECKDEWDYFLRHLKMALPI